MKPKYITPENYHQFKPSEFVRSFKSDIEVAEKSGKRMDMIEWFPIKGCLPCLGGMACLNMGISPGPLSSLGHMIANLGNNIRLGYSKKVLRLLRRLYPKMKSIEFHVLFPAIHSSSRTSLQDLKDRIDYYADQLEKSGQ